MSVKISELPILDSLADNDVLAGVDTSANVTKKIELATLKDYIDTNTTYTAGTNIDITNNVVSAPNVYNKTETDELLNEKDEQIEELQEELDAVSTIYNAFPTASGEGESLSLDDTSETKFKKFNLKGNTSQETTTGKNLLDLTTSQTTIGGIPISVENGVIKINGTTSSSVANWYCRTFQTNSGSAIFWIEVTGYTDKDGGNASFILQQSSDGTNWSTFSEINLKSNQLKQYSVTLDNTKYYRVRLYTSENTFTNATIKAQLEYGDTKTDFEPYTNGASPNPDYPQDIHVVSGDNEIVVDSGDALQGITLYDGYINSSDVITSASNWKHSDYIDITDYDYYIVEGNQGTSPKSIVYNANKSPIQVIDINYNSTKTWNLKSYSGAKYLRISTTTGGLASHHLIQRSSYQVNLPVENILDFDTILNYWGAVYTKENGTYTLTDRGSFYANPYTLNLEVGKTYTLSGVQVAQTSGNLRLEILEDDTIVAIQRFTNETTISGKTFIVKEGKTYTLRGNYSTGDYPMIISKPQLEEGTKQNSYTPYGTTPIELCKIGDYQDYFLHDKTLDKWYLHKEVGKLVLDENSGITSSTSNTYKVPSNLVENIVRPTYSAFALNVLSDYLIPIAWDTSWSNHDGFISMLPTNGDTRIKISSMATLEALNIWLTTNNISIYYPCITPTDTEITYQPLIEQLNALEKAMSYNGQTNISQVNNDKPFIISAEAIMSLQNVLDRIELLES